MNEAEHLDKINSLAAKICTLACPNILAVIHEYDRAVEDFRRWAKDHPAHIPVEKFRAKSECVIHKIRWTNERKIEFAG